MTSNNTVSILHRELFSIWRNAGALPLKIRSMHDFIISAYKIEADIMPKVVKEVDECVRRLSNRFQELWITVEHSRTASIVLERHTDFMDESFQLPAHVLEQLPSTSGVSSRRGRKTLSFKDSSEVVKRRKTMDLRENYDTEELLYAAMMKLNNARQKCILKSLLQEMAEGASGEANQAKPSDSIEQYSALDAVALIVDLDLSKSDYNHLRAQAKKRNCNLYPSYDKVLAAKKTCCPPECFFQVDDTVAEVQLQALLDHTSKRILETSSLDDFTDFELLNVILTLKWGSDGTSGQSQYKQKFSDDVDGTKSDANIYLTCIAPIRAETGGKILFQNPVTSSTRYCRPVRIQFVKETTEVTLREKSFMDTQIENLRPTELQINGRVVRVSYRLHMTMIDGKVMNAVTGTTSAQRCNICHATPKEMNNIPNILSRPIDEEALQYGLSILHAKIRFFEYFLHLGYKTGVEKWKCSRDDAKLVQERKKVIQVRFKKELWLNVDMPRSDGSGSSNDGNTARCVMENVETAADILGVDVQAMDRCATILQVISCGRQINLAKFKDYCIETAQLLVSTYPWYYLPASVHKVLMHGAEVISQFNVPIGQLSEESLESLNRILKKYRLDHTRKTSRTVTNGDLIRRLLVASDPRISGLRVTSKKKDREFSHDALYLLDIAENEDEADAD